MELVRHQTNVARPASGNRLNFDRTQDEEEGPRRMKS